MVWESVRPLRDEGESGALGMPVVGDLEVPEVAKEPGESVPGGLG